MAPRPRFKGTTDGIITIVEPWVTKPLWLEYPEENDAEINRAGIEKMFPLVFLLTLLQANLSFTELQILEVFKKILANKLKDGIWLGRLKKHEEESWVQANCNKLRKLLRDAQQSRTKKVAWIKALDEKASAASKDTAAETSSNALTGDAGWCAEMKAAYREKANRREYTKKLHPLSADDLSVMVATFDDGEQRQITELLKKDWDMMTSAHASATTRTKRVQGLRTPTGGGWFWAEKHEASGLMLSVRPRKDRKNLMVLNWGPKLACMIDVDIFNEHGGVAEAFKLMKMICRKFAAGEIDKSELYKVRNAELHRLGIRAPRSKRSKDATSSMVMKRPAAATKVEEEGIPMMKRPAAREGAVATAEPVVKKKPAANTVDDNGGGIDCEDDGPGDSFIDVLPTVVLSRS